VLIFFPEIVVYRLAAFFTPISSSINGKGMTAIACNFFGRQFLHLINSSVSPDTGLGRNDSINIRFEFILSFQLFQKKSQGLKPIKKKAGR
jgi:hypothetical protein